MSASKENILNRIRQALATPTDKPMLKPDFTSPIYQRSNEDPSIIFAETFIKNKGEFYYCESETEFIQNLILLLEKKELNNLFVWEKALQDIFESYSIPFKSATDASFLTVDAGVTLCECLIARTGSIMISSRQAAGRRLGIYPPIHVVVAYTSQLLPDIKDGLALLEKKYGADTPSMMSMITGPSRTADIEKTLVLGAHGPKELILFLIED